MCEVYTSWQHLCKWAIRATQRYEFVHQNGQITKLSSWSISIDLYWNWFSAVILHSRSCYRPAQKLTQIVVKNIWHHNLFLKIIQMPPRPPQSNHRRYWSIITTAVGSKYLTCPIIILQKLENCFSSQLQSSVSLRFWIGFWHPFQNDGASDFITCFLWVSIRLKWILLALDLFKAPEHWVGGPP